MSLRKRSRRKRKTLKKKKTKDESYAPANELGVVQIPSDKQAQATQSGSASTIKSAPFESRFSGEHTIQTVIGRGGFGIVFKAQHKLDERLYAIKRVYVTDTEQSRNKVLGEVRLMALLDHPHIVRYHDSWLEKPPPGWQQDHDDNLLRELRSRRQQQQNGKEDNVPPDPEDVTQTETKLLAPGSMVLVSENGRIVMADASEITNPIRADDMNKKDAYPMVDSKLAYLYIKMEFCCGSTLHKWLGQNQRPDQRPISQTLDWFSQLVSAVKYIHDAGLIHRDIKPQNIFGLPRDGAVSVLKIGDLGLAIDVAPLSSSGANGHFTASSSTMSSQHTQNAGTSSYMSPEQESGNYKNSTDIFSLGLVFLEMLHSFKTNRERYAVFGALRAKQRPAVMNKLDKEMKALISRMTAFKPEKRATSSELDNELKKMEHLDIGGPSVNDGVLEGINFTKPLPFKLALKIFGYLHEGDLAQCALVSREFRAIADHQILWKSLYQEVFEYSRPLLHVRHAQFEFLKPHDWPQPQSDESIVVNPWKESFKQLRNAQVLQKDGIHVRPGYASLYSGFGAGGRRLTQCDYLSEALQLVKARGENAEKLIFLHTGFYIPETRVMIDSDIQIIGASAGPDIVSQVIIEGRLDTTVVLAKSSQGAYLGWMTVRFAPYPEVVAAAIAAGNSPTGTYHSALQICDDSTALVEHCVIHSSATVEAAICVKGSAANPRIRHCVVCDCESAGIHVRDEAQGQFEDCEIARNKLPGVVVDIRANPFFRRCHIHDCRNAGILMLDHGMGYFESCNIHNNRRSGIEVRDDANPTVTLCEVHHGQQSGVYVHKTGRGQFTENRIHSNELAGIEIEWYSDPKITRNKIWGNKSAGVRILINGQGVLEDNEIFDNAGAGVVIETDSNPTLRRNKIYDGREEGVRISGKGRGVLEENDIYRNAQAGVLIESESNPTLRKNRIYEGHAAGIEIGKGAMPTLESNAIFHNRFGGLFLATDAKPTLHGNNDNDDLVEKTIAKGGCLSEITSFKLPAMHDFYRSYETDTICLNCIRTCHAGHAVRLVRCDLFFCRCGGGAFGHQCKLSNKVRDNDSAPPPVDSKLQ